MKFGKLLAGWPLSPINKRKKKEVISVFVKLILIHLEKAPLLIKKENKGVNGYFFQAFEDLGYKMQFGLISTLFLLGWSLVISRIELRIV